VASAGAAAPERELRVRRRAAAHPRTGHERRRTCGSLSLAGERRSRRRCGDNSRFAWKAVAARNASLDACHGDEPVLPFPVVIAIVVQAILRVFCVMGTA